jgi:hypothetical protein
MLTALLVLLLCVLLWLIGGAMWRAIVLALIVSGICVCSFKWGSLLGGPDQWNVLISVATLLAVLAALLSDVIGKLVYRERISVYVGNDLIDFADGVRWARGRVTNSGDRAVERCRVKVLKVDGQPSRIENGLLQWSGGKREAITLSPQEHLIFDIGTRSAVQGSPFQLLAYMGPKELSHDLVAAHTYRLALAIYGDNIRTRMTTVAITIGAAADEIEIP